MIVLPAAVRSREKGRRGDEVAEMDEMKEMVEMDNTVEVVEMYKMVEVVENSCFLVIRLMMKGEQKNYKIQVEF